MSATFDHPALMGGHTVGSGDPRAAPMLEMWWRSGAADNPDLEPIFGIACCLQRALVQHLPVDPGQDRALRRSRRANEKAHSGHPLTALPG